MAAREMLIKMLIELRDSPFKEGTVADLRAHEMPLFEILIRQFLDHVGDIVRKGIARTYVSRRDNLVFLRGKLRLAEHIRYNAFDQSRLYCEFDEYEIDRPVNRLIKGALKIVSRLARDATNQQRCREFLFWFDQVSGTKDSKMDFRTVQKDRMIQHYELAMPTCRLILEDLNPLTQEGDRRALSPLFPMNQVFEDYASVKLRQKFKNWQVSTQINGQTLVDRHRGKKIFRLIPDLEFRRGKERVLADTKWKLLDQNAESEKYGISQADIYQLFAYSQKYLSTQSPRRVILIFPSTDTFNQPLEPFWFEKKKDVLYVLPYDLAEDRLITPENFFLYGDQ